MPEWQRRRVEGSFRRNGKLAIERAANDPERCLGNTQNEIEVLFGNLIDIPHENPTRTIDTGKQRVRLDQPEQLLVQGLIVACRFAIKDDEVGLEALQPPVSVSKQYFAHQVQALRIGGGDDDEGEIT